MAKYPMTPEQQATAERRGWGSNRTKTTWTKPKNFTPQDQGRIDAAEARRIRRGKRD